MLTTSRFFIKLALNGRCTVLGSIYCTMSHRKIDLLHFSCCCWEICSSYCQNPSTCCVCESGNLTCCCNVSEVTGQIMACCRKSIYVDNNLWFCLDSLYHFKWDWLVEDIGRWSNCVFNFFHHVFADKWIFRI